MQQASTLTAPGAIPRYVDRRVHITLATAAVLWGMYSAYTLFFSPLFAPRITLGPDQNPVDPYVLPGNQPEERRQAEQHLSSQPWAAEPKGYHFRTDSGFFYFKNWDNQVDNGRKVRFKPFAMIWRPKGHDPQKPPYTIVSESAVVEFTSKFEMSNPNPGRIIGGAMEGDVQVRGPDGLAIDGQQFFFGEQVQRVWSDHAIRFQHGPHTGKASGVELDLIAHPNPNAAETLAITGVRTVRLRKAVEMKLVPASKPGDRPSEPVHVDCQGAFEYDVANYIATFEQNVRVRQTTGPGQADRLNCDTLTLVFERDDSEKATSAEATAPPQQAISNSFESKLKFRRLRAEGREVTVSSQRSEMQGWMKSLTYDEQARIIALSENVRLLQKNNEVLCPEITAELDEEKKQIERVECRGSGQLYQYARGTDQNIPTSKKRREVSAKWQRKLNKAPDPATGLDLIELEGRAELQRIGEMSLEADVIGIWVTRGTGRIDRDLGDAGDDSIQPKKLLALRDVRFASPQIGGRTDHLAVWFEEGRLPPPPPVERKVSDASNPATDAFNASATNSERAAIVAARPYSEAIVRGQSPAATRAAPTERARPTGDAASRRQGLATVDDSPAGVRGGRQPAGRGTAAAAAARPGSKPDRNANPKLAKKPRDHGNELPAGDANARLPRKARDNPLAVTAELIQVRAMRDGDRTEIAEVVTEGRVHVQQEHAGGELPLDVTGDKLLLWNYGDTNQVLQVYGKPAQVQDRKLQLEGPDIRFDRVENRAIVNGAGVLRVPVPRGMDGKPLPEPQLLDVFWKEKMDFDGLVAKFFANVRSQLNGSELKCEEMYVTFNRRVNFADDGGGNQPQTDIHSVVCRDGVDLKSYEYQDNRLVSVRKGRGFEFSVNQSSGDITSQGPGTLELWRRAAKRDGAKPGAQVAGNRARQVSASDWEYTRIIFHGKMTGNIKQRITKFRDVERIVYGSVPNSTETIDEERLPADGGWMQCRELTLIQIPESKGVKEHITLKGVGNVVLDGRSFHALAHKVTFDESKDLYILTGDGKHDATVWREVVPGGTRSQQSSQELEFIPSENKLRSRVSQGDASP